MRAIKIACYLLVLVSLTSSALAVPKQASAQALKPAQWLSGSELGSMPAMDDMTLDRLENMSLEKGAKLCRTMYHLSQMNHNLQPSFVPSPSNIPVAIYKPDGQKVAAKLNTLISKAKELSRFGEQEVTIFITGFPQTTDTIKKATKKLVQAYMQRYNLQKNLQWASIKDDDYNSSEERSIDSQSAPLSSGNLIIVDLGSTLTNFKRYALLDIEETGRMVGQVLLQLTNELNVPPEIIHLVAQGVASHVAGAAGNAYAAQTGNKLRRITALDPSKIMTTPRNSLVGLSRGDADFVDAIHTAVHSMGTPVRSGNIDFYPNGPSDGVSGASNVVEASMRATRYFAESVRPGNERNFPAIPANSIRQYKNNDGIGGRAYMGLKVDLDLEGDYMLQVNSKSPFGRRTPSMKPQRWE